MNNESLEVGVICYPGSQLAAVHGMTDLFSVARRIASDWAKEPTARPLPILRVRHWCLDPASQVMSSTYDSHPGAESRLAIVVAPPCLEHLPRPETVVGLLNWLRSRHAEGTTLASVCRGAFILGYTGLLNGRVATTHWQFADELAKSFPAINVDANRLIADEGDILTSGGLMAWVDLGLVIVQRILGPAVAAQTARYLVADPGRQSQSQYIRFNPSLGHGDEPILRVQQWLQSTLASQVRVHQMAEHADLGEKTFTRRFIAATGLRPTAYMQQLRIEKARELLELTRRTVDRVAWDVGYQDPSAFRQVFQGNTGLTPREYRRKFSFNKLDID